LLWPLFHNQINEASISITWISISVYVSFQIHCDLPFKPQYSFKTNSKTTTE